MNRQEEVIEQYFHAWITKDLKSCIDCFSKDVYYSECYGPVYHGVQQIEKWFTNWNQQGAVRDWRIHRYVHQGKTTVVTWFFACHHNAIESHFDGISMIDFDDDCKISSIKEFQSKAEHNAPYDMN